MKHQINNRSKTHKRIWNNAHGGHLEQVRTKKDIQGGKVDLPQNWFMKTLGMMGIKR